MSEHQAEKGQRRRWWRRKPRNRYRGGFRLVTLGGDWSQPIPDATAKAAIRAGFPYVSDER